MSGPPLMRRLFWSVRCGTILACAVWLPITATRAEWRPLGLVLLLAALALVGQWLHLEVRGQTLSAGFVPVVLAMSLLGPAQAVAIAATMMTVSSLRRHLSASDWLTNVTASVLSPLAGALLVRALVGDVHTQSNLAFTRGVTFALVVFAVFIVANFVNFMIVAVDVRVTTERPISKQVRELFVPMLPSQIAAGALGAILAAAYTNLGLPVLLAAVLVLLIFQYLTIALLRSEERADQLEARSIHLASLQVGVLSTLVETLALRDRTTARHAAAVARYARELAREIGCSEEEVDLAHTAGLLHDIGKFALPDRILHADVLSDEDWDQIRRHPQDGATLVGRLDGYGAVAEAILYHHERIDGSGYPAGLIGNEIPLASRIIAVCSTYDTMTSRHAYRSSKTPQDAIAEMRRVAGRQLDAQLVEAFVPVIARAGLSNDDTDYADFEAELEFERRTRRIAQA